MTARSILAGAGLLALGACLGIVVGSLLDAPRLLLQRLQDPVASVELGDTSTAEPGVVSAPAKGDLAEYAALQEAHRPTKKVPAIQPEPAFLAPAKVKPVAKPVAKPPAPKPPESKPAPATKPEPRAEDVIQAIAKRAKSPAPAIPRASTSAPTKPGSVAQVGAFGDTASAQAMVDKLRGLGFDSYISNQKAKGRYSLRVRVRPSTGTNIAATAARLKERGFDVWVTKE